MVAAFRAGSCALASVVIMMSAYRFFVGSPSWAVRVITDNLCLIALFFTLYAYAGAGSVGEPPAEPAGPGEPAEPANFALLLWTVQVHLLRGAPDGATAAVRTLVTAHMLAVFFHNLLLVNRSDIVSAVDELVGREVRGGLLSAEQQALVVGAMETRREAILRERERLREGAATERARALLGPDREHMLDEPDRLQQMELQQRVADDAGPSQHLGRVRRLPPAVRLAVAEDWDGDTELATARAVHHLGIDNK